MAVSGVRRFFSDWKPYKIAFNILSLLLALLLTLMLLSVVLMPSFARKLERFTLDQYLGYYQTREQQALLAQQQGDMALFARILSADFADIQKGDRVYPQKRKLLLALCADLYRQGDYIELLHWAATWFQLDERDVTALAYYYQALWLAEHNNAALLQLKQARQRFPRHLLLQEFTQLNRIESSVDQ